jgi:hypothetical protein
MPIYQVIKVKVLQGLLFIKAETAQDAEVIAETLTPNKEVVADIQAETIWRWEDDDPDAPTYVNWEE